MITVSKFHQNRSNNGSFGEDLRLLNYWIGIQTNKKGQQWPGGGSQRFFSSWTWWTTMQSQQGCPLLQNQKCPHIPTYSTYAHVCSRCLDGQLGNAKEVSVWLHAWTQVTQERNTTEPLVARAAGNGLWAGRAIPFPGVRGKLIDHILCDPPSSKCRSCLGKMPLKRKRKIGKSASLTGWVNVLSRASRNLQRLWKGTEQLGSCLACLTVQETSENCHEATTPAKRHQNKQESMG